MKISIRVIISVIIIIVSSSCSIDIELTNQNENIKINYIPKNIESEKNGLLGQLLLVKGEGFFLDSLSFYFDEKPTYAFLRNKDTLFVKIPRELNKIESTFKILIGIKDSLLYSSSFRLRKPKISSYSKNEVTFGESFWVYGNNFDNDNDYINTFLNDINIGNSYFHFDSLKVTVPNNILQKKLSIRVEAQLQEDSQNNVLQLKEPIIENFPSEVYIGSSGHILKGKYFNPESQNSKILINDDINTNIYYTENNENIDLIVPYGPYKDFKINSISYETAGMKIKKEVKVKIASNHILYSKSYPISSINNHFTFNNEFYVISNEKGSDVAPPIFYIWKFDFITQEWTKDERIQIQAYGINISEIKNGVLFIYKNANNDGLFKLDMNNFTIENLENIPNSDTRSSPSFFTYNNYLYLGKGVNTTLHTPYQDLYKLNLNSSSSVWENVNTDNNTFYQKKAFTYNSQVYLLGNPYSSSSTSNLYKYNPSNSSFELINSFGYEIHNFIFLNDKYYSIGINPNTKNKRVYKFEEQYDALHSFHLNSTVDDFDFYYFSFNNEVYFIGNGRNEPTGIFKLSNDIKNKIN